MGPDIDSSIYTNITRVVEDINTESDDRGTDKHHRIELVTLCENDQMEWLARCAGWSLVIRCKQCGSIDCWLTNPLEATDAVYKK